MTRFTVNPTRNGKRWIVQQVTAHSIRTIGSAIRGYTYEEALNTLTTLAVEQGWTQVNDHTWEVR